MTSARSWSPGWPASSSSCSRATSASLLFFGIFLVVLYVATERLSWLLIGLGLFVAGARRSPTQLVRTCRTRFDIWLHPFADTTSGDAGSYQLVQGLFGLATGGIFGTGLGQGRPDIVPVRQDRLHRRDDRRGARPGRRDGDRSCSTADRRRARPARRASACATRSASCSRVGLAFCLALQVFVQVGGVTRLIPLTGLTLPFLSYGGSQPGRELVVLAAAAADQRRRPAPRPAPGAAPGAEDSGSQTTQVVRR